MSLDLSLYRPNVGVVLFNPAGKVWLGRRAATRPPHNWQFPQGGIDEGEDLEVAALRELKEETGVHSVELVGRTKDWLVYEYPPGLAGAKPARGYQGQKQIWFALRFLGEDSEVDLDSHGEAEFDAWRWAELAEAPSLIVPFKRPVYEQVVAAFDGLV